MTLFRISAEKFEAVPRTTFAAESVLERKDLQRLLRADTKALGDDLLAIAEEYGNWEDSNRRIDLLCLSKSAGLVVVEIKRTEDGGHMELQAVRYAAMVSSMTLENVIHAYIGCHNVEPEAARQTVLTFLGRGSEMTAELTGEVRIILVAADFSTELTTAVLWLNKHDLDITCVRLRPHRLEGHLLIDCTQIIPLPESHEYEVKIRAQQQEQRKKVSSRQETLRRFWTQFIERAKGRTSLFVNRTPSTDQWLSGASGRTGFSFVPVLMQSNVRVECYVDPGDEALSMSAFEQLAAQKQDIEADYGNALDWQPLPGKRACRICSTFPGGWATPESEWPSLQDQIIGELLKLELAFKERIQKLML
jgi:hypothetical protein